MESFLAGNASGTCELCSGEVSKDLHCFACVAVERKYARLYTRGSARPFFADADFIHHEIAHHIILFRRVPRTKRDFERVTSKINKYSYLAQQWNELRVLALQHVVYRELGFCRTLDEMVGFSWLGLQSAARYVFPLGIQTQGRALAEARTLAGKVSPRNAKMYRNVLNAMRTQ